MDTSLPYASTALHHSYVVAAYAVAAAGIGWMMVGSYLKRRRAQKRLSDQERA